MEHSISQYKGSLLARNPIMLLMLGLAPALAVATTARNGIVLGAAVAMALFSTNITIDILNVFIPKSVRYVCYFMITVTYVSVIGIIISAQLPVRSTELGIYLLLIPLISVNCVVLGRAEVEAGQNGITRSAIDSIAVGFAYVFALVLIGGIREIAFFGTLFGLQVLPLNIPTSALAAMPAGAFLAFGFVAAVTQYLVKRRRKRRMRYE